MQEQRATYDASLESRSVDGRNSLGLLRIQRNLDDLQLSLNLLKLRLDFLELRISCIELRRASSIGGRSGTSGSDLVGKRLLLLSKLRNLLLQRGIVVLESADGLVGAGYELLSCLLGFFDGLLRCVGLYMLLSV